VTTRNKIIEGDDDPRHGTVNGYRNHGCRCPECRVANTVNHHEYMNADPERAERHRARQRAYQRKKEQRHEQP
jgi:hypothetical protein